MEGGGTGSPSHSHDALRASSEQRVPSDSSSASGATTIATATTVTTASTRAVEQAAVPNDAALRGKGGSLGQFTCGNCKAAHVSGIRKDSVLPTYKLYDSVVGYSGGEKDVEWR